MPRSRPSVSKTIASVNPHSTGTPDTVLTVAAVEAPEGFTAKRSLKVVGITATGILAAGSGAQIHVGILRSGESAWEGEVFSHVLDGGEWTRWPGTIRLEEGDSVESYASVTNRIDVTVETEDF